jgi:maltose alpha-D-glucosyltransferase/alpha-amylase
VHPDYGTVGDAAELIDEAHRRGIRVIADMVMNHTSDQHPWFQESRQSATNPRPTGTSGTTTTTAGPRPG